MTGKSSAHTSSGAVSPTKLMDFPYKDTRASLSVGCAKDVISIFVTFNVTPNLNNTDTKNGYNKISTRIKFDNDIQNVTMLQSWSSKLLYFTYESKVILKEDSKIISKLMQSNNMLLELDWHGNGKTYFKFPLSGSTKAINRTLNKCGK